jgi:hypothetical protein
MAAGEKELRPLRKFSISIIERVHIGARALLVI